MVDNVKNTLEDVSDKTIIYKKVGEGGTQGGKDGEGTEYEVRT